MNQIGQAKPPVCMALTVLFLILIMIKLRKNYKFQKSNNMKSYSNTLRISAVILLQALVNIFLFSLELYKTILTYIFYSYEKMALVSDIKNSVQSFALIFLFIFIKKQIAFVFSIIKQMFFLINLFTVIQ